MSVVSRSDGSGPNDVRAPGEVLLDDVVLGGAGQLAHHLGRVRRDRPTGAAAACSCATTWYSASSHIAVALMVIEVFMPARGMSANSARMSPTWEIGTPTLPTSPRASAWSGS